MLDCTLLAFEKPTFGTATHNLQTLPQERSHRFRHIFIAKSRVTQLQNHQIAA